MNRFLLICFVILAISACGGGDDTGNNNTNNNLPSVINGPGTTPYLTPQSTITLIFSESMQTSSLQFSGDMAVSATESWTQTNVANDTLVISPTANWNIADLDLVVDVADPDGNAIDSYTIQPQFVSNLIYVSGNGSEANPGTRLLPKRDLSAAVQQIGVNSGTILVAAGDYAVSFQSGTAVTILGNVSIRGGYSADFSRVDLQNNISRLVDGSTEVVVKKAIVVDANAGDVDIDGLSFDIQFAANNSAAIEHNGSSNVNISNINLFGAGIRNLAGGNVVLRSSVMTGSNQTGAHSCPLIYNLQASSIDMEGINVTGCNTEGNSTDAIQNFGQARIVNNTIYGGEAERIVRAVRNSGTISELTGNNIDGGVVRDSSGSFINTVQTEAVNNGGTITSMRNNNIFGGTGGIFAFGLYSFGNVTAIGNTIYGGGVVRNYTYGIGANGILYLENNVIFANSPNHLTQPGQTLQFGLNATNNPELTARNNIFYTDTAGTGFGGIEIANNVVSSRLENNIIYATNSTAIDVGSVVANSEQIVQNNTIYLIGESSVALNHDGSTALRFDNNLIHRSVASAIRCGRITSNAVLTSFANNNFGSCTPYLNYNNTDISDLAAGTLNLSDGSQQTLAQLSNIDVATNFVNAIGSDQDIYNPEDNNLRPSNTNPVSLLQGGLDLSADGASATDFTGQTARSGDGSTGWTMGVYEID